MNPDEEPAFPSMIPSIPLDDFVLVVGRDGETRVLKLAISNGSPPRWNQDRRHRVYPARGVAAIAYEPAFIQDYSHGDIGTERMDLHCERSDTILIYTGCAEIDRWCMEPVEGRREDAIRVYRMIVALGGIARNLPSLLGGIIISERGEVLDQLMLLLSETERRRKPTKIWQTRTAQLILQAHALGLQKTEYVRRAQELLQKQTRSVTKH